MGLLAWIVCWKMFLILCFFCCLMCRGFVCSGGATGTGGLVFVLDDVSKILLFCCPVCVAAVFAVGLLVELVVWILCWMMFPILCCFMLPSLCDGCLCGGGSSGTGSVDFGLNDDSNTMLFSVS